MQHFKFVNWGIRGFVFGCHEPVVCKMNILTVVCILLSRVSPFSTVDIVQLRGSTCCSQKLIQISCILMSGLLEPKGMGGALCVQMDFTRTFQTNAKCNNINPVWSHFCKMLVVLKYHRRLWDNIFDTDLCRSITIPKKAKYTTLM